MKNQLANTSRVLLLIAAAGLVMVLFNPIWRIELDAPQYPEGLSLTIHASGLKGNVDIINGLNHYIGMKTLHNEDFIEFKVLPYCIVFFALAFLAVAIIDKRKWLNALLVLFILFGIIAMVDFWRWEYNYGHNLNPNAAIVVPGMAYQPPLIGFKQLLNFGAYSTPDTGGWIFIGVGLLGVLCVFLEWKRFRATGKILQRPMVILLLIFTFSLSSCHQGPEPINIGKDNCSFCKMTISDRKYGAELITQKGKVYKFDDLHCLLSFMQQRTVQDKEIQQIYLADYGGNHSLIKASESLLLQSDVIHGPMNGNIIACKNKDSIEEWFGSSKTSIMSWDQLIK